jgi:hypothetical protein
MDANQKHDSPPQFTQSGKLANQPMPRSIYQEKPTDKGNPLFAHPNVNTQCVANTQITDGGTPSATSSRTISINDSNNLQPTSSRRRATSPALSEGSCKSVEKVKDKKLVFLSRSVLQSVRETPMTTGTEIAHKILELYKRFSDKVDFKNV